eukprot:m.91709 g.91709  ORF g.91709 m.91709 type:complete len:386 (+) comp16508_c1_seq1:617-1774(+)
MQRGLVICHIFRCIDTDVLQTKTKIHETCALPTHREFLLLDNSFKNCTGKDEAGNDQWHHQVGQCFQRLVQTSCTKFEAGSCVHHDCNACSDFQQVCANLKRQCPEKMVRIGCDCYQGGDPSSARGKSAEQICKGYGYGNGIGGACSSDYDCNWSEKAGGDICVNGVCSASQHSVLSTCTVLTASFKQNSVYPSICASGGCDSECAQSYSYEQSSDCSVTVTSTADPSDCYCDSATGDTSEIIFGDSTTASLSWSDPSSPGTGTLTVQTQIDGQSCTGTYTTSTGKHKTTSTGHSKLGVIIGSVLAVLVAAAIALGVAVWRMKKNSSTVLTEAPSEDIDDDVALLADESTNGLQQPSQACRVCTNCGYESNVSASKFCMECGTGY